MINDINNQVETPADEPSTETAPAETVPEEPAPEAAPAEATPAAE